MVISIKDGCSVIGIILLLEIFIYTVMHYKMYMHKKVSHNAWNIVIIVFDEILATTAVKVFF